MKPNIANFVTPTGQHGNLFSPSSWIPMIMGVGVFLATFAVGQKLLSAVHAKLPSIPSDPMSPFTARTVAPASANVRIWS